MIGPAQAARIMGEAIEKNLRLVSDFGARMTLRYLADSYLDAAHTMDEIEKAAAEAMAAGHKCSIDHRTIKTPKCPACGAPKGSA